MAFDILYGSESGRYSDRIGTVLRRNLDGIGTVLGECLQEEILRDTRALGFPNMGASLLSFVPTYMTKDHHRKDGKCFGGKEPIGFVTRTEATGVSRLPGGDFFEPKRR